MRKIIGAKHDGAVGPKTLQAVANFEVTETIEKLNSYSLKLNETLFRIMRRLYVAGGG